MFLLIDLLLEVEDVHEQLASVIGDHASINLRLEQLHGGRSEIQLHMQLFQCRSSQQQRSINETWCPTDQLEYELHVLMFLPAHFQI